MKSSELFQNRIGPVDRRGMALVTTIILLGVLMGFGVAIFHYYTADIKFSGAYRSSREALYLAEAGVQEALKRMALPTGDSTPVLSLFGSGSPSQLTSSAHIGENLQTGDFPSGFPNPNWITRIYPAGATPPTPGPGETHTQAVTSQAGTLNYTSAVKPILVTYKREDSVHHNGTVNGEVVLYGQNFGYSSPAPATGTQPVYVITATGKARNGTEKTVQIETARQSFRINLNAALASGLDVKGTGSCFIDGTNHNKLLDLSWGTAPGEYKSPSDDGLGPRIYNDKIASGSSVSAWAADASTTSKLAIVTTPGNNISTPSPTDKKGAYTWGASGSSAVQVGGIPQIPDFKDFLGITQPELDVLLNSADVTLTDLNNGAAPRGFTYINNPGSTFMYSASTPDPIGFTLLYVKGNLKMTANTHFKGVIFVEGDFTITGSPTILGGVVVRGDTDTTFSPGNINILYSRGVIEELNNNLGFFKTLVWREITR